MKVAALHEPSRKGDVRDSLASIDLARDCLGYVPRVDVEDGIRRTVKWYRARKPVTTPLGGSLE